MSLEQVDRLRAMLLARRGETPTIEERRARFEAQWAATPLPDDIVFTPTRIRDDLRGLWVDAPGGRQDRVMLWLHGGAFMLGSAQSYRDFGARLARAAGVRVLLLDYRLAPEHPFPAALTDTGDALDWLEASGLGAPQLAIGGDSCGGNLALAALQQRLGQNRPQPAALWLISPYLDLTHTGASIASRAERDPFIDPVGMPQTAALYLGGASPGDPRASPLFGPVKDLPPTLIQVGSDEVLFDDARRLANRLTDATFQEWVGMVHVWPLFAEMIDEGAWAIAQGGTFVAKQLV